MSESRLPEPSVTACQTNVRIEQDEARRILARLEGMPADEAHQALKFRAGTVSAPLARVLEQGVAEAARFGIRSDEMVVGSWTVGDGDVITRLRRMAHGIADWITTRTTRVEIRLRVVTWRNLTTEEAGDRSEKDHGSDSRPNTDERKVT